ncbi:unnamed protein product [Brassica rapa subsp. trilocularis]
MFDKDFKTFQRLPKVPSSDYCFFHSDKETICYNADAKSWTMINGMHKARNANFGSHNDVSCLENFMSSVAEMRMINTSLVEKVMMRPQILRS